MSFQLVTSAAGRDLINAAYQLQIKRKELLVRLIASLSGFNVRLELCSGLLLKCGYCLKDSPETCHHYFDPAQKVMAPKF